EADRVAQDERRTPGAVHEAGCGIERLEETVGGGQVCARHPIEQRRLAGVRVADEGDDGQPRAAAALTLHAPVNADVLELTADLHDAAPDHAAVGFELRFAGTSRPDAAAEALEVSPLPDQARKQIGELGELDLELALGGARPLGEDVEDQRGTVD